jgi:transcriptional regulator with XRE-family HTH domain
MSERNKKKLQPGDENPMPSEAFRAWRRRLGLKQKDAADLLGLKKRMIQYYETGSRNGSDVAIPKSIRLACYALQAGVGDYDGHTAHPMPTAPAPEPPMLMQLAPEPELEPNEAEAAAIKSTSS